MYGCITINDVNRMVSILNKKEVIKTTKEEALNNLMDVTKNLKKSDDDNSKTLKDEGVSKDMAVYFIVNR